MKRYVMIAIASLVASFAIAGCVGTPADSGEEVGHAEEALNCVATCVQEYSACVKSGEPISECRIDRESCKAFCNRGVCEKGTPGCCDDVDDPRCF